MKTIREYTLDDWSRVNEIFSQGVATTKSTFLAKPLTFEEWHKLYVEQCRFVIEEDGYVVGWCALLPYSSKAPFVGVREVSIYIDNNYQGKGFGKALLGHLVEESIKCGIWTLQAAIFQDHAVSIKLHESFGFKFVGVREDIAKTSKGEWKNIVLLERREKSIY